MLALRKESVLVKETFEDFLHKIFFDLTQLRSESKSSKYCGNNLKKSFWSYLWITLYDLYLPWSTDRIGSIEKIVQRSDLKIKSSGHF